jgi:hypothetical protein
LALVVVVVRMVGAMAQTRYLVLLHL